MDKPFVVGISGGSGSGKTRFVKELLGKRNDVTLHCLDNYYIDRHLQEKDKNGIEDFDRLTSIDTKKFVSDLTKLIRGEQITLLEYRYNNEDEQVSEIVISPKKIILVEGIFALHLEDAREHMDLKIFIEAPSHLMLKRRIIRDAEERGYDIDDVLYRFEKHVMPSFEKYVAPSAKWADLIIPNINGFDKGLEIILQYINAKNKLI